MNKESEIKIAKKRLRSSYFTIIISITLVLLMLGLIGILLLKANDISNHVKENIKFTISLSDSLKETEINRLKKKMDAESFTKETKYISKEEGAEMFKEELGEDFIELTGVNPLPNNIDIKLKHNYANNDSLTKIEKYLETIEGIDEITYQKDLVNLVNENVKKISALILVFSLLLFFISFTLINNTIRLSVYSKRFLINTMKLVGATPSFIRGPFMFRSIINGLISGVLSIFLLIIVLFFLQQKFEGIVNLKEIDFLVILFASILIIGIFISRISTYFAVNKFIKLRSDELYY